jgi:hypothetical protein
MGHWWVMLAIQVEGIEAVSCDAIVAVSTLKTGFSINNRFSSVS